MMIAPFHAIALRVAKFLLTAPNRATAADVFNDLDALMPKLLFREFASGFAMHYALTRAPHKLDIVESKGLPEPRENPLEWLDALIRLADAEGSA